MSFLDSKYFTLVDYDRTSMIIFLYFIAFYVFFSLISASIVVSEEREKDHNSPRIIYGGFLIGTSLVWFIFLLIAIYYTHLS